MRERERVALASSTSLGFPISMKISLNMIIFSILFFQVIFLNVKAQHPATIIPQDSSQTSNNFQPSLVVVIGILAIMFSLTFFLLLYAKFCYRSSSILSSTLQFPDSLLLGSWRRSSGIDKTLVESLPFFRFSSLKGSRHGLECSVCLSRFEDIEILRLLPTCKHAFHIDCIDQWLEKHSTCPLCRHKVSAEDLSVMSNLSTSLRFLSESRQESNLEIYIERQESFKCGSDKMKKKEEEEEEKLPIIRQEINSRTEDEQSTLHKKQSTLHHLNHRIIVSDVVLNNRWSSVSSSDLLSLTSEFIRDASSHRFSSSVAIANRDFSSSDQRMSIKEEMERKRLFEIKINNNNKNKANSFPIIPTTSSAEARMDSESATKLLSKNEKRSMSEIVVHPRFIEDDERRRNVWLPIARNTVQWFAKRENRSADESQIIHNP